jgi:hypothetical protein
MRRALCLLSAISIFSAGAAAQQNLRPFSIEVSALTGGSFDLPSATAHSGICNGAGLTNCVTQTDTGKKFLPLIGGGVVVSLRRWIALYGEYDYLFPDRHETSVSSGAAHDSTTSTRHYWIATGGAEFQFPTIHGIVPVLRIGGGQVYDSYNYYDVGTNVSPPVFHYSDARGTWTATGAGGIKWYLRERQGLRFMFNGYYLGHSLQDVQPSPFFGTVFVTRRSGASITAGYFIQLSR